VIRTILLAAAVLAAAVLVLDRGTDGFRALTAEGARRVAIADAPRPVPQVTLEGMDGAPVTPSGPLLVEFIYTNCPTLCVTMGDAFARLRARLAPSVRLLSISFDPDRDDPDGLRAYAARHGADGKQWTVARPRNRHDLAALLTAFGITVIPDPFGGFEHNAAIHLVDAEGRLAGIFDIGDETAILAALASGKGDTR
jgi:protein SCO1/2